MNTERLTVEEMQQIRQTDISSKEGFVDAESVLAKRIGAKGSDSRSAFDAKAKAWYYGEILRSRRKELNLTQKELAESVGKERTYINRIEKGETDMQLSSFIQIAEALGITLRLDVNIA